MESGEKAPLLGGANSGTVYLIELVCRLIEYTVPQKGATPRSNRLFIEFLSARIALGEFRAVIDRKYPLRDIADAYRYVETEQKAGIVVIEVVPEGVC